MAILKNVKKTVLISILILFVYVATLLIPNSASRYQRGKNGNGQTPIASWGVSAISSDSTINLIAGSTTTYTFTVNNSSDVSVEYSIEITNIPTGLRAKLDSGSYVSESNNKIVISNAGELGYSGTTQRTHTLTFNTPLSSSEVSNRQIGINVIFKQKIS